MLTPLVKFAYSLHQKITDKIPFRFYWMSWNSARLEWVLQAKSKRFPYCHQYHLGVFIYVFLITLGVCLSLLCVTILFPVVLQFAQVMFLGLVAMLCFLSIMYDVVMLSYGIDLIHAVNWSNELEEYVGLQDRKSTSSSTFYRTGRTGNNFLNPILNHVVFVELKNVLVRRKSVDWLGLLFIYIVVVYTIGSFLIPIVAVAIEMDPLGIFLITLSSRPLFILSPGFHKNPLVIGIRLSLILCGCQLVVMNARAFALIFLNLCLTLNSLCHQIFLKPCTVQRLQLYKQLVIVATAAQEFSSILLFAFLVVDFFLLTCGVVSSVKVFKSSPLVAGFSSLITFACFTFMDFFFEFGIKIREIVVRGLDRWKVDAWMGSQRHRRFLQKSIHGCGVIELRIGSVTKATKQTQIDYLSVVQSGIFNLMVFVR